ncbi:hypothetical protein RN001_008809 [Aquatica leii]|uniref:Uncharacterized protein n=1 Tax=Aquatica leii TaxID=1421715 RepID=A0AAN7SPD7_9COLE|nr:hypothetical protein RN001_008809 [Aquatica leii]
MAIGNINKKTSQILQKNFARKAKKVSRLLASKVPDIRTKTLKETFTPVISGISDRSASTLVSAVLQNFQVISKENSSKIMDRSKIIREQKKRRTELREQSEKKSSTVIRLYFDGKKDKTILQEKIGTKYYKKTVTEEHIVLISDPNCKYLGHITPTSGSATNIALSLQCG